jgi:xanthine dehydrogenase accessory factor
VTVGELRCLVRGVGDVGSAVAHILRRAGYAVALHDGPAPTAHRRGMAFVDAVFDGHAVLEELTARRIDDPVALLQALAAGQIVVHVGAIDALLAAAAWDVLVDARLRKRAVPEDQRGRARLMIGLGPNFVAGTNCHVAIETGWDNLGAIVNEGATAPLRGEPSAILGRRRDRLVYAPVAGLLTTGHAIGDLVAAGDMVAQVGGTPLTAPLDGALRGLTRSGVSVTAGTKVIEIDPRGRDGTWSGLGERPRRIGEAVLQVIRDRLADT